MAIERIFYCDGPDCERHVRTPRVELFARRARFGWDYWGDESLGTAQMPEAAA